MSSYKLILVAFGAFVIPVSVGNAQVVTDGTTGAGGALTGPDYDIDAALGTQAGTNLFHSFEQFSIGTGESATFSGPGVIENIIGRVTGGDISSIDGRLASTIPGADLWLFNPAGIIFGPNASLDLTGSFHASTADEVRTADGGKFSAVDPASSGFSVAEPESFGFLGADPAGITIAGSQLSVDDGQTLSVVGGDVDIAGAGLTVGDGQLNVLAAGGPADANVATGDLAGATDGAISVRQASLAATGDGGGAIRIEGGEFVVDEGSLIVSTNTGPTDGGTGIDVDAETIEVTGDSLIATDAQGDGKGGTIDLQAEDLQVTVSSTIGSNSSAAGDGGDININGGAVEFRDDSAAVSVAQAGGNSGAIDIVADDLTLIGSDIATVTGDTAAGDGGNISIAANSIELRADGPDERASIATNSFGSGAAGDIDIRSGRVLADGESQLLGASIVSLADGEGSRGGQIRLVVGRLDLLRGGLVFGESSGGSADASSVEITANSINIEGSNDVLTGVELSIVDQSATTPGAIVIRADDLDIQNGGTIDSSTTGAGNAADIVITAGNLSLGGQGSGSSTKISSSSSFGATGNAGRITIVADKVDLSGDASISSSTFSDGDAGVVNITAETSILLRDASIINTSTSLGSTGNGGSIVIDTGSLSLFDAGSIESVTGGVGNAGSIDVTADTALLDARNVDAFGGIATQAVSGSSGDAGEISLTIGDLTIRGTAAVSSSSFGAGNSGAITVTSDEITIDGRGANPEFVTGITTSAQAGSTGDGGTIAIVADRLVLRGSAADVASANLGTGSAGTIDIRLADSLVLDGGGDITTTSASAGGGGITIVAGNTITATGPGALIRTTVADDTGDAGDILIETPLLALGDSQVLARADAGRGGDIQITTDDLVLSPDAQISADAGATGIDGTVAVSATEVDLTSSLATLDGRFLDVSSLLRERCAARRDAAGSSFTLGTGGSLPADLDAPRLSLVRIGADQASSRPKGQRTVLVLPCPKAAS